MKKLRISLYVVMALLSAVCGVSLLQYGHISEEIAEEREEAQRTADVLAALVAHARAGNAAAAPAYTLEQCVAYLHAYKGHEQAERYEASWGEDLMRIDDKEIDIVEQIVAAIPPGDASRAQRLETLAAQLAVVETIEAEALSHTQARWHAQRLWTGVGVVSLLLLQLSFAAGSLVMGNAYRGSLGEAETRFGRLRVADRYLVKRTEVEDFELQSIRRALQVLPHVRTILDIPCGTGRFVDTFRAMGLNYYGADASAAMVALTREHRAIDRDERVVRCNILDIPFPDRAFDCVFVMRLLHHVPHRADRIAIFRELARKTRHGVVVSFFDAHSLSHLLYAVPRALALRPLERYAVSAGELREELREAGLEVVCFTRRLRGVHRAAMVIAAPAMSDAEDESSGMPVTTEGW